MAQNTGKKENRTHSSPKQKADVQQRTDRELKFLDYLFGDANFNATLAYKMAGFKPSNARHGGCLLCKKLSPIIQQWLEDAGLSDNQLKMKILEKLDAKQTKILSHNGVVTQEIEIEDHATQLKALEFAMKMKGMFSEKSSREIEQIDELIEIELERLRLATR